MGDGTRGVESCSLRVLQPYRRAAFVTNIAPKNIRAIGQFHQNVVLVLFKITFRRMMRRLFLRKPEGDIGWQEELVRKASFKISVTINSITRSGEELPPPSKELNINRLYLYPSGRACDRVEFVTLHWITTESLPRTKFWLSRDSRFSRGFEYHPNRKLH